MGAAAAQHHRARGQLRRQSVVSKDGARRSTWNTTAAATRTNTPTSGAASTGATRGRVFKNWRVEAFESPANVEYRLGADFGFSIDPIGALRCWIDGTQIFVDHEAWGLGVEIVNLPKLFMSIPDAEKWWMTADSSRPETISHLRNNGFPRIQPRSRARARSRKASSS
jgi:hypothetical protein